MNGYFYHKRLNVKNIHNIMDGPPKIHKMRNLIYKLFATFSIFWSTVLPEKKRKKSLFYILRVVGLFCKS